MKIVRRLKARRTKQARPEFNYDTLAAALLPFE